MKFDSKAEAMAADKFAKHGATRFDSLFGVDFIDKNGEAFRAKPDFWHQQYDIYIEYKPCELNNKTSKRAAENKMHSQAMYRGGRLTRHDELLHSWSNSAYKQSIVQERLGYLNFVVCFEKNPTFKEAKFYEKRGIRWCTLASLRNYLAVMHFQKRGLAFSFKLETDEYTYSVA